MDILGEYGQRPFYELQSSFWPPAPVIVMIMVGDRNYDYNYSRCQELLLYCAVLSKLSGPNY